MKINWRLVMLGISAAAIAIAAAPEATPPRQEAAPAGRVAAPAQPAAARTKGGAKEKPLAKLDMERLRRLQPAKADAAVAVAPVAADAGDTAAVQETPAKPEWSNAFAAKSWYVPPPPPPPPKPEPPPKPMAPPLPFTYVGRYDNPEKPPVVLLLKADRLYTVSEGEAIEGTYRIDRIEKGRVELIYLPLHQRQVLPTGEPG